MSVSLKANINSANPNTFADAARVARMGSLLSQTPRFLDSVVASNTIVLPTGAKAAQIINAFASVATSAGAKLPVVNGSTPAAGQVAVTLAGDILFNGTDAVLQAEVMYITNEGEVITELVTVAASAGLFAAGRKSIEIRSAVVTDGVTPGTALTPIARGATPSAGEIALTVAGTGVDVNAANVVAGSVTVTYKTTPGEGTALDSLGTSLDASADNLIP